MAFTSRALRGYRLALAEVLALVAAVAVGLALDRAYAPTLFTRSTSNFGDRLAILFIIMTPCVVLGMMALLGMRVLLPRLRWRPPARLGMSLLALGIALIVASGLMGLVMRSWALLREWGDPIGGRGWADGARRGGDRTEEAGLGRTLRVVA